MDDDTRAWLDALDRAFNAPTFADREAARADVIDLSGGLPPEQFAPEPADD